MQVELTEPQQRTLRELIGAGDRPTFASDLPARLRERIERAAAGALPSDPLWLGKEKLNQHARCEGHLHAAIAGEAPPFEHSAKTAAGVLLHAAVEVEVGARDPLDPHQVAGIALARVNEREERFAHYWDGIPEPERDDVLMEVVRRVALFGGTMPPLKPLRGQLAPISEMPVRAELLDGLLVLAGRIDLVLGLPDRDAPTRATRLAIDLKSGGAYPEFAEDMRFYALVMTLRFGVPPYRVASLFLESGTWQAEDVTEDLLVHAADRVAAATRSIAELSEGREPALRPGRWCEWCPRSPVCPVAELPATVRG